jgi:hypothetical protein
MSNGPLAIHSKSGTRRSTRVRQAIQLAVQGIDAFRGPYHETVSTLTINCHGCLYESQYEELPNAFVKLELNGRGEDSKPISRGGRVKWTQRSDGENGLFLTAIELTEPGNFWGIDSPPSDWLSFSVARASVSGASTSRTLTLPRSEATPAAVKREKLERILAELAEAAIRKNATALLKDLRQETERVVSETATLQAERARVRDLQWTEKIEIDLQQALRRLEVRNRELEEISERLTIKAQAQLQRFLEVSRTDTVARIVTRLKQQSAPVIDDARRVIADLAMRVEETERIFRHYADKSTAQVAESCNQLDKQLESILRERIGAACDEFTRAANVAATSALSNVRASAEQEEAEAQTRLHGALEPMTESAIATLKQRAADISRQFAGEMSNYSRSHLEHISAALIELAKGIEKLSKRQAD